MSAAVHADQCACFDILDKDALAFPDTSEQDAVVVELSDLTRHQNTNMRNTASRHTLNWSHLKSRHPSFLSMHVTHTLNMLRTFCVVLPTIREALHQTHTKASMSTKKNL